MKFPERLTKCLTCQIDFNTFYVLDILKTKKKNAIVLLAPKAEKATAYYGMIFSDTHGHWYTDLEQMLHAAHSLGYIGKAKCVLLRHRYKHLRRIITK